MVQPRTRIYRQTTRQAVLVATLGCVLSAPALAAQPDSWITTKSKLALLTTEGVSATAVRVDTVNQQVTLHGMVSSPEEKAKAESVVRTIDGVKSVRNLLQVVAPRREKAVQRSDDELKKQIETKLQAQPSLKDSAITLQSVSNGVVLLGGTATTLGDHLSAIEVASAVPGVRYVSSEIQSPDAMADKEIWYDRNAAESAANYSTADASRDMWITSVAKMRLLADSKTPALDINVDTRDGAVTLFGMVPTKASKRAAEADVRKVSGVRSVKNELQVVAAAKQPAVKALDEDLKRDVLKSLRDRTELKDVDIEVKNCVARLTGTVPGGSQRLEAAVLARSTAGVCSVHDDMRIAD